MTGSSDHLKRLKLVQRLSALAQMHLDQIIFALNPPKGPIPGTAAPQGERVTALLQWVENTEMGCGLATAF